MPVQAKIRRASGSSLTDQGFLTMETLVDQVWADKGGLITLVLRQTEPWGSPEILSQLQSRVNDYARVITTGGLCERYPDFRDRPTRIRLVCYHAPPESVRPALDSFNRQLQRLGIGFQVVHIAVDSPTGRGKALKEKFIRFFKRARR